MKFLYTILIILISAPVFSYGQSAKSYSEQEAIALMKTIEGSPFTLTKNHQAQWFPTAGLGLFIHWGIHSVAALDPSWTMIKNCPWAGPCYAIGSKDYYQLANEFNPSDYDPEKWVIAAKHAGFQYVVLTTKHHDGYCLWPSKYGDWNTAKYMNGRDLLKPYVAACRKYGLKVGFYFSPRDWGNPVYPIPYPDYDYSKKGSGKGYPKEINQQKFDEFYDTTIAQLSELLTHYGKIDILWFDGVDWPNVDTHPEKLHTWLRAIQPEMVINPRWSTNDDNKPFGDFKTEEMSWSAHPEKRPENVKVGDWWEFCTTWSGNWGYSPTRPFMDIHDLMKTFVYARSFGGNYLMNIGPAPDGTMRPGFYKECLNLASWMENNKESVIGTQSVDNWQEFSNVPLTQNNNCYYAHVLKDHKGPVLIREKRKPANVLLLNSGKSIPFEYSTISGTEIQLNDSDRQMLDDVIKLVYSE